MDHIKVGHGSAGKRTLERYCAFSDQHFMVQRGARTEPHRGYFSYFTKPWSRLGLQFRPLLWSWKSNPSNYTVLPRDDVKMITVHCMSFPPHQSPGPEPTGTCPSYKQQFNTFLSIHSENNIIYEHDLHFSSLSSLFTIMLQRQKIQFEGGSSCFYSRNITRGLIMKRNMTKAR